MTKEELNDMTGAELLRLIVSNLNTTRESFNDQFSLEELVQIHRMFYLSDWDIYPDDWTKRQVKEALRGVPPQWTKDEKPKYSKLVKSSKKLSNKLTLSDKIKLENRIAELEADLYCALNNSGPES